VAGNGIFAFDNIAPRGFEFAQDCSGTRQERFTDFGEADGAAKSIEQPRAELRFQFQDLLGQRWLGNVAVFRSARKAARIGDSAKIA
jgi:hypothetical protein